MDKTSHLAGLVMNADRSIPSDGSHGMFFRFDNRRKKARQGGNHLPCASSSSLTSMNLNTKTPKLIPAPDILHRSSQLRYHTSAKIGVKDNVYSPRTIGNILHQPSVIKNVVKFSSKMDKAFCEPQSNCQSTIENYVNESLTQESIHEYSSVHGGENQSRMYDQTDDGDPRYWGPSRRDGNDCAATCISHPQNL